MMTGVSYCVRIVLLFTVLVLTFLTSNRQAVSLWARFSLTIWRSHDEQTVPRAPVSAHWASLYKSIPLFIRQPGCSSWETVSRVIRCFLGNTNTTNKAA